jgi:hypothetical protein
MADYEKGRADERAEIFAMIDRYQSQQLESAKANAQAAKCPDYREALDCSIRAGAAWLIKSAILNDAHISTPSSEGAE